MKKIKIASLLLALMLVLSACGGSNGGGGAKADKETLTVAVASDATGLDPYDYGNIFSELVMRQIYNKLMEKDVEGNLVPSLAEKVVQKDDLTYEVTLREGIKFHNGEALTPQDIKYTLTRIADSPTYGYIFGKIDKDSFEIADEKTLTFKITEPDGSFLSALSHPAASILNEKAVTEAGENYAQNPVGTGPFKFDSRVKLDSITLTKNEDFWGDKPAYGKMILKVIPEPNNRLIELESGNVDIALSIAPNDISKIEENSNLELFRKLDNSVHFVALNVTKAPFDNPVAREALAYAIDMKSIVESVYMGVGQVATGPVNPNFPYSISNDTPVHEFNVEKAKELFKEAGVAEGTVLKIYVNDNQQRKDIATIMQSQLQAVGLNADITTLEWGAYVDALENKEDNMFIMSWSPSVIDPHYALFSPFHTKNMGEGPNYMYYSNPELDNILDEAIKLTNSPQREQLYKQAQEIVIKDKPWLFVSNGEQVIGAQSYVKNFEIEATSSQDFSKITFE